VSPAASKRFANRGSAPSISAGSRSHRLVLVGSTHGGIDHGDRKILEGGEDFRHIETEPAYQQRPSDIAAQICGIMPVPVTR
jgi:hypothetical protein